MRRFTPCLSSLAVLFVSLLVADARFARGANVPVLSISIAVPKGNPGPVGRRLIDIRNERSHFHVVVTNSSARPVRLWETWNSWGYYNLRFEVADAQGKLLYTIAKKPRVWTVNIPSWFELAPGEHFVIDVSFDRDEWDLPFLKKTAQGDFPLRLRAVFEIEADKDAMKHQVWTGRVDSPFNDYLVSYRR